MPICNKPSLALSPAKSATDLNDHASEAAKMKRTREQAYFNSYNFDAIEQVLPYGHDMQEMEGEVDGEEVGIKGVRTPTASNANTVSSCCSNISNKQQQNPQQQQQPQHNTLKTIYRGASSLTSSQSNPSSSRSSICESHPCDRCSNDSDCYLHQPHSSELTYAYMQRFGTLLMHSRNPSASSHFVEEDGVDGDVIGVESGNGTVGRAGGGGSTVVSADVAPVHGKCETVASLKENFLLPRAMLKYQSVGNANSMPLAANCGGRADKLLQNGHNNRKHSGNSNKNNNNINNDDKNNNNNYNNNSSVTSSNNKYNSNNKSNNSGGKTIMMNTNAMNNNNKHIQHNNNNNNISSINKSNSITNTNNTRATNKNNNTNSHNSLSSHNSHTSNNNNNNSNNLPKNRQKYANNKDGYASLLVDTDINAIAPFRVTTTVKKTTTVAPAAVAVERPKHSLAATNSAPGAAVRVKKPSTSSTITTTTTESSASAERNDNRDHNDQDHDGHEKARSNGKGTTSNNGSNTKLAQSTGCERRGRTNSHQSHYSTDKSGSSGYYSSNVCSTYSLDEHIYCEPVIDILDVSKSKSARLQTTTANTSDSKKNTTTTTKTLAKSHVHEMSHKGGAAPKRGGGAGGSGRRSNARATITNTKTTSRHGESGMAGCSEEVDGTDECDEGEDGKEDGKDVPHIERGSKSKDATEGIPAGLQFLLQRQTSEESQHFSDNLRILETSIENLDRHLKQFPSLSSHERIAAFVQSHHHHPPHILQEHHHPQQQHAYLPSSNHTEASDKLASTRIPPHTQHHHQHAHHYLPTIMEGYDPTSQPHRSWPDEMVDDSLLDIDLDSFLLVNEKRKAGASTKRNAKSQMRASGIDNPTFLTEEQEEENNLKCAQYINSCPDDAYRVESDIVAAGSASVCDTGTASEKSISLVDHYMKRYEDQMHFQSTRELLEDVRDKIRLLSQASGSAGSHSPAGDQAETHGGVQQLPHELEGMIKTLKKELENYLDRMNQHSELEIRQLCSGLVRNHNIVKMKKAFERRRSTHSLGTLESDYGFSVNYEAICDGVGGGGGGGGVPTSIRDQIVSIRCASDPNFKMKRKSLSEVFPVANCYTETAGLQRASSQKSQQHQRRASLTRRDRDLDLVVAEQGVYERDQNMVTLHKPTTTQLQRNLSFKQPSLNQIDAKSLATPAIDAEVSDKRGVANSGGSSSAGVSNGSGAESGESGDKDSILEWHRKKPSIWEMYYGTNRMNQSLLGKRNALVSNNNTQVTMSYPSSRPESDFTLDLPRAEQLRIKMEKEKKFRQRCRYITTFLSLVFFLLTVMVVSLVLTRGKRMFGSMI